MLRRLLWSFTLSFVSYLLMPPASVAQTSGDCAFCVGSPNQTCEYLHLDGSVSCVPFINHCPGASCCNGRRSGTCTTCEVFGDCTPNGGCTGTLQCPDNYCCVNGNCYPDGDPQCQPPPAPPAIQRPSEAVWAAYPWITSVDHLVADLEPHSVRPRLVKSLLEAMAHTQLVYGVHYSISQRVVQGSEAFIFHLATTRQSQTLTIYQFDRSLDTGENDVTMDVVRGKLASATIETLTLAGQRWTLVNAKGTFTGTIDAYVPMPDPKACTRKATSTLDKKEKLQ